MEHAPNDRQITQVPQKSPESFIKPRIQELKAPVKDIVAPFAERPLYYRKKVTRKSKIPRPEPGTDSHSSALPSRVERSLYLRRVRAKLLEEFKKNPYSDREKRKAVLSRAADTDSLAKEFLNQGEVHVSLPDLGEQVSRFAILNSSGQPEQTEKENKIPKKPAIVIIPGISNDLDSIEAHAQTVAYSGRKIVAIGYPEGYAGKVTQEFADAVEKSGSLSTHVQFFKEAISALTKDEPEIEIWGLSTGAVIVAELLSDPSFSQKAAQAVLIGPASSVEQSTMSLTIGWLKDMQRSLIHNFSDIVPSFVWFTGKRGEKDKTQIELRNKIFSALQKIVTHKSPFWQTMHVKDGGNITVIAGGKDEITKSYKATDEFSKNSQVQFAIMPGETHLTSFNSVAVLNKISELQSTP